MKVWYIYHNSHNSGQAKTKKDAFERLEYGAGRNMNVATYGDIYKEDYMKIQPTPYETWEAKREELK